VILPAALFILTLASGVWLHRRGRPLSAALFNIHKLIALAAVALCVFRFVRAFSVMDVQAPAIPAIGAAALSAASLFVTGALLSGSRRHASFLLAVHRIGAGAVAAATALLWFLINRMKV
jgi:hypothetical protein